MRIRTIRLRNESRSVRVCTIRSVELSHLRLSAANLRRPIPQSPASSRPCDQSRVCVVCRWFLCDPPYPPWGRGAALGPRVIIQSLFSYLLLHSDRGFSSLALALEGRRPSRSPARDSGGAGERRRGGGRAAAACSRSRARSRAASATTQKSTSPTLWAVR